MSPYFSQNKQQVNDLKKDAITCSLFFIVLIISYFSQKLKFTEKIQRCYHHYRTRVWIGKKLFTSISFYIRYQSYIFVNDTWGKETYISFRKTTIVQHQYWTDESAQNIWRQSHIVNKMTALHNYNIIRQHILLMLYNSRLPEWYICLLASRPPAHYAIKIHFKRNPEVGHFCKYRMNKPLTTSSQFYWWRKSKYSEKTTDLSQVTHKF
jgi:hypothetical protein